MQILMAAILIVLIPLGVQAAPRFTPPGPNVALGKSYTLEPAPNYRLTTDEGDLVQLTDGAFAPEAGSIWFHKECVGWYGPAQDVVITVDLEQDMPIAGVALSTQAGGAGVTWPSVVLIAVSRDGEQFHLAGELLHLASKHGVRPPAGRHVFATDDLRCRGRYVRLVIPRARYIFTDEIEIYRGVDESVKPAAVEPHDSDDVAGMSAIVAPATPPFTGERLDDISGYLAANQVAMAVRNWVAWDIFRAREELASSHAPEAMRHSAAEAIAGVAADNNRLTPTGEDFRSIFPLTAAHEQLFRALGALRGAEGRPRLQPWNNNRWQRLSLWDAPAAERTAGEVAVQVRMIQSERRADTINITNHSAEPISARVWLEGLPGGATPGYVSLRQAEYVALASGRWDADALPEADREDGSWIITLPAGISRQLWLAFHPGADVKPGAYQGAVVIETSDGERLHVPLSFTLEPLTYPNEHTLSFGMWDYAYPKTGAQYGINPDNLAAAVAHMRSYGYNVPWSHIYPWVTEENFDDGDRLVKPPDMSRFDAWVALWPDARYYAVFFGSWPVSADRYAGVEIGSEKFTRRVAAVMRFWADHVRSLGIEPRRILLLTVDEPSTRNKASPRSLLWARTIKAAVPEFTLFVDPTDHEPQEVGLREMYEAHDILCPHINYYLGDSQASRDFYEKLRAGGRELWLYNTSGGPASLDAIAHHRGQQWKLWPIQGTGTHYWAYADVGGSPGGSWNQFAASGEIYTKVYLDRTSVTDGKHWLAIIEGIQDYEYLRMLRDRITELEVAGSRSASLDRARKALGTLPEEAIKAADAGDLDAYDHARLKVLDVLLTLRTAEGHEIP